MTSYETVDNLRLEKERCINDLRAVCGREIDDMKRAHAAELRTRSEWLSKSKEELDAARVRVRELEFDQRKSDEALRTATAEIETLRADLKVIFRRLLRNVFLKRMLVDFYIIESGSANIGFP